MNKLYFCTLFNSAFLARGIVLLRSLKKHCPDFHLYVFAFDQATFEYLSQLKEPAVTVIPLSDFEDAALLKVKKDRTAGEYCWTCTPSTVSYCLKKFKLPHCTYLDADLKFFSDPNILLDEMGKNDSVMITPHRYTPEYDMSATSGIYCVQFITFKNTIDGNTVLEWWRKACLDWCYARFEDGKFGDQKYLDDWTTRFRGVHELKHHGGGVAPWNLQQYEFRRKDKQVHGKELKTKKKFTVVFFHYHDLRFPDKKKINLSGGRYVINAKSKKIFYDPYVRQLIRIGKETTPFVKNPNGITQRPNGKTVLKKFVKKIITKKVENAIEENNLYPLVSFKRTKAIPSLKKK